MTNHFLTQDLKHILKYTKESVWNDLRNANLFITGGTGFFGKWLLESFLYANEALNLNAHMTVLTRNPAAFLNQHPHLQQYDQLTFIEGDVKNFHFPKGPFSHVIHAATEASAHLNENDPLLMLDTIMTGTRHTLEFAKHCGAQKFLLTSSGAVYGRQPPTLSHVPETYSCQPPLHDHRSAYAVGKCTAEHISFLYAKQFGLDIKIARCFAFVGPYLPLDIHFAIGNFIRDGLKGGPIIVNGDGRPYRSYLYAADLVIWLWTILIQGKTCIPYNVGSDEAFSIAEIAHFVAQAFSPQLDVHILKPAAVATPAERYIPETKLAQMELGLVRRISLPEGIKATREWALSSDLSPQFVQTSH